MVERKEVYTDIQVAPATEQDVEEIQRLCFGLLQHVKQWSPMLDENWLYSEAGKDYLTTTMNGESSVILKATAGDEIAGFVIGSTTEKPYRLERKFADIDFFYVDPKFRRHHIGSQLMQGFTAWSQAKGAHVMRVETTYSNVDGQAFYRNKGFSPYELVMERKL
jgi:ribosomal protein S18 acetylase RimI-like enzyme